MPACPIPILEMDFETPGSGARLADHLPSWNTPHSPVGVSLGAITKHSEPLLTAYLRYVIHHQGEMYTWRSPHELGLSKYRPLLAATLLFLTDDALLRACEAAVGNMIVPGDKGNFSLIVTPHAILCLRDECPDDPIFSNEDPVSAGNILRFVQLVVPKTRTAHSTIGLEQNIRPLVEFANLAVSSFELDISSLFHLTVSR